MSLIKMHRSVRAYKSEPVLSKALDVVLEAGTYAPTGGRHQSPTIIAIIDSKYRRAIAFFGAYFKVQQLVVMTVNGLIQAVCLLCGLTTVRETEIGCTPLSDTEPLWSPV